MSKSSDTSPASIQIAECDKVRRTLLLDLDGTLVDTVPDLTAALNRLMASRGLPAFAVEQVTRMVGDGVPVLIQRAFAARARPPDDQAVADFLADYDSHVAVASRLYPAVTDTLSAMVHTGWRLAVCTNKPERAARMLLQAMGLLPLLQAVGGGDSFTVRKPDPRHLLETLALAGGDPRHALMLGDHHNDVASARGAGIGCIFALWGYGAPEQAEGALAVAHTMPEAAAAAERLLPA
jgi:phosphoglycolate phosphatase